MRFCNKNHRTSVAFAAVVLPDLPLVSEYMQARRKPQQNKTLITLKIVQKCHPMLGTNTCREHGTWKI